MNTANQIEYIAADARRQQIPWVCLTNRHTGAVAEYTSTEQPFSAAQIAAARRRTMDCIDCHNRPAHRYRSPRDAVNLAMENGEIDPALPYIKREAVKLLAAPYLSSAAAAQAMETALPAFYRSEYPEMYTGRQPAIVRSAAALAKIYRTNYFPAMKARWDAYPDNSGHLMFEGCARCHDGLHRSADGKTVSSDCSTCHTIVAQGKSDAIAFASGPRGLAFEHPEDISGAWQVMKCTACHTGAAP